MYIPRSKYSEPKFSEGVITDTSGKKYTGYYFTDHKGRMFAGKSPESNGRYLGKEELAGTDIEILNEKPTFTSERVGPTEKDYETGVFKRYFLQHKQTKKIIEVGKKKYYHFSKKSNTNSLILDWNLSAPSENQNIGPYIYFGSAAKNKELVENQKIIPELTDFITAYNQFIIE